MVDLTISDGMLVAEVRGAHKLFAMKSRIEVPLSHVRSARHDPVHADRWFHGFKMPGTEIPGLFAAGTFWTSEGWRFWDVRNPDMAITIELIDETLAELIVEVEDPTAMVDMVNEAVRRAP